MAITKILYKRNRASTMSYAAERRVDHIYINTRQEISKKLTGDDHQEEEEEWEGKGIEAQGERR